MESFCQGFINNLLTTASWVERLQNELGVKGVSQVFSDQPVWYFWLADAPGAYSLSLAHASPLNQGGASLVQGIFVIKYYPAPTEPAFEGFSAQERSLVRGSRFDHSHTPVFEAKDLIDPNLFVVATLEVISGPEQDWALFTLEGQDQCRTVQEPLDDPGDPCLISREVPGWQLAYPLFQRLLSMYAFHSKSLPARAALNSEQGFSLHKRGEQTNMVPTVDFDLHTFSILFAPEPGRPSWIGCSLLDQELNQVDQAPVFDLSFTCGHFHGPGHQVQGQPLLSEAWWRLSSAHYQSHMTCLCGGRHE